MCHMGDCLAGVDIGARSAHGAGSTNGVGTMNYNEHDLDGISIRRDGCLFRIIHEGECIGIISADGWEWHTSFLWRFRSTDLVTCE